MIFFIPKFRDKGVFQRNHNLINPAKRVSESHLSAKKKSEEAEASIFLRHVSAQSGR